MLMNNLCEVNRVAELRRMPEAQRNSILVAAAEQAADAYTNDPELKALQDCDDIIEEEAS